MLSPMMSCAGRIRANACPFGSPDGVASQFQLADRHGHAVTKDVRIQSIHQTDWQGRVELSDQPRTNQLPNSSFDLSYWSANADASIASSPYTAPDGSGPMTRLTVTGDTIFVGGVNCLNSEVTIGQKLIYSFVCRRDGANAMLLAGLGTGGVTFDLVNAVVVNLGNFDDAGVKVLPGGDLVLCWAKCTAANNNTATVGPARSLPIGTVVDLCCAMQHGYDDDPLGAYIHTTASEATVTDYTHDGSGGITTGQVPVNGAVLDWTGTARRVA